MAEAGKQSLLLYWHKNYMFGPSSFLNPTHFWPKNLSLYPYTTAATKKNFTNFLIV